MTNQEVECGVAPLSLLDLPDEILLMILSARCLQPLEIPPVALSCPRLHRLSRQAPFKIAIKALEHKPKDSLELQEYSERIIRNLCQLYPGISELDLSDLPIDDTLVSYAISKLPALQCLYLSGCKKLTPALVSNNLCIRSLFMQRAFQMDDGVLTSLLQTSGTRSLLQTLALSHLSMDRWSSTSMTTTTTTPISQLRYLALHNCTRLCPRALATIASSCPMLRMLCLGGCIFASAQSVDDDDDGSFAGTSKQHMYHWKRAGLAMIKVLDGMGLRVHESDVYLTSIAVQLGAMVDMLTNLQVLEVTFCAPGLASLLNKMLATSPLVSSMRKTDAAVKVWDMCSLSSVVDAAAWQRQVVLGKTRELSQGDAAALVSAAARCSSPGRVTPLHAAAEEGNVALVQRLLVFLNNSTDARDRRGATALFAACEAGHAAVALVLLEAGANATLRNTSGEAPLYIAALRGHEAVVDVLLRHFTAANIRWQDPSLYGDGWTPLHAAAVGGRCAVVLRLLAAAGDSAAELVRSTNRYGQTAVHVAARKGSTTLLQALVDVGGPDALSAQDDNGQTAAEVASRNGNAGGWKLLGGGVAASSNQRGRGMRAAVKMHKGTTPTLERPRAQKVYLESQGGRWIGRRLSSRKEQGACQPNNNTSV